MNRKNAIKILKVVIRMLEELVKQLEKEDSRPNPPKPKGKPKSDIFHRQVDEGRLASCICDLHRKHFNSTSQQIEVDGGNYNETDFMLCIYFALIKLELAPSIKFSQFNRQYYSFLTDKCQLKLAATEKTYNNHSNKVKRTGCDLHILTEEIIVQKESEGSMKPQELPLWQEMLAKAESLLLKHEYISSLSKK